MTDSTPAWPRGVPAVGQAASRTRAVTARDIELFTEMTGDRNPLHYDEAAARASRFGEIVVQGGVTSAILNAVVAEELPGPGTVFLEVNWRFKAPVRPGDTITGRVEVVDVHPAQWPSKPWWPWSGWTMPTYRVAPEGAVAHGPTAQPRTPLRRRALERWSGPNDQKFALYRPGEGLIDSF